MQKKAFVLVNSTNSLNFLAYYEKLINETFDCDFFVPKNIDIYTISYLSRVIRHSFNKELFVYIRNMDPNTSHKHPFLSCTKNKIVKCNDYDILFLFATDHYELPSLASYFSKAKIVMYEDGLLSYKSYIYLRFKREIDTVLLNNYLNLFNLDLLKNCKNIVSVNKEDFTFYQYKDSVTENNETELDLPNNSVIIMPNNHELYNKMNKSIDMSFNLYNIFLLIKYIEQKGWNCFIKPHPRSGFSLFSKFDSKYLLRPNILVESLIKNNASKNILAISNDFSTSVLSLKHFFNVPSFLNIDPCFQSIMFNFVKINRKDLVVDKQKEEDLLYSLFPKIQDFNLDNYIELNDLILDINKYVDDRCVNERTN